MKIVIPSRKRADLIGKRTLALFPSASACVEESEVEAYERKLPGVSIVPHPPLKSLAEIRNWIIDNTDDGIVFMPDDDVLAFWSLVGKTAKKYTRPEDCYQIVENTAEIARGIGAGYFGFSQSGNPLSFIPHDPIRFSGWVGSCIGIVGKDLKYDPILSLYDDADFTLQNLLHKRIIYSDDRFHAETAKMLRQEGGNTKYRSSERSKQETDYLLMKWGRFIGIGKWNNPYISPSLIKRRQV